MRVCVHVCVIVNVCVIVHVCDLVFACTSLCAVIWTMGKCKLMFWGVSVFDKSVLYG